MDVIGLVDEAELGIYRQVIAETTLISHAVISAERLHSAVSRVRSQEKRKSCHAAPLFVCVKRR